MTVLRILLSPFTLLHAFVLRLRHVIYDLGVIQSTRPDTPTIAIGNLALGGTGKTPMVELVLRTLSDVDPIATLSRGYGRKGNDILEVLPSSPTELAGDEPLQVKRKFSSVRVFVGADRVHAIEHIRTKVPALKAIILDDALQHRKLNPSFRILLTTWQRPYCDDVLFPAGTLRDLRSRAEAAEVVVVTKCPVVPIDAEKRQWRHRLRLEAHQELYFSGIEYDDPVSLSPTTANANALTLTGSYVHLFTGIANPEPLLEHVRNKASHVEHIAFNDHHAFSQKDLTQLAADFGKFAPGPKMLVTTEKDAARLSSVINGSAIEGLPIVVIGMKTVILNEPERFAELIHRHVTTH